MASSFVSLFVASVAALGLAACASSSDTPSTAFPESEPKTSQAGTTPSTAVGPIFYLDLTPGCYSYTTNATSAYPFEFTAKEMYGKNCSEPHHFEVFAALTLSEFDAVNNLGQNDAEFACSAAYEQRFKSPVPREVLTPAQLMRTPYLIWYFPDDGLEASQFPGKLVCAGVVALEGGTGFEVIDQPFAAPN